MPLQETGCSFTPVLLARRPAPLHRHLLRRLRRLHRPHLPRQLPEIVAAL